MERLRAENEALTAELRELTQHSRVELPDLEGLRDRILKSLEFGGQSSQFKVARKALNQFIRELRRNLSNNE